MSESTRRIWILWTPTPTGRQPYSVHPTRELAQAKLDGLNAIGAGDGMAIAIAVANLPSATVGAAVDSVAEARAAAELDAVE